MLRLRVAGIEVISEIVVNRSRLSGILKSKEDIEGVSTMLGPRVT
jgi:hypothetical protein